MFALPFSPSPPQIFEAYGLGREVVDTAFVGSVSRIGGMSLADIQRETEAFWAKGFPDKVRVCAVLCCGGLCAAGGGMLLALACCLGRPHPGDYAWNQSAPGVNSSTPVV